MSDDRDDSLTRPKKRATKPPRPLKPGHPEYDAKARADLDRRKVKIGTLRGKTDVAMWMEGDELAAIADLKLYRQDGCNGIQQWVKKVLKRGKTQAGERMGMAKTYSLAQVKEHGWDKLLLLQRYVALTRADDRAWSIGAIEVMVPTLDGVVAKSVKAATPEDLEDAIEHQQDLSQERSRRALASQAGDVVGDIESALALEDGRKLAKVSVRKAASGLAADTRLNLSVRLGDLRSMVERLARTLLAKEGEPAEPSGRGGPRRRNH